MQESKRESKDMRTEKPEYVAKVNDIDFWNTRKLLSTMKDTWKMWPTQAIEQINSWDILTIIKKLDNYENLGSEVAAMFIKYWQINFVFENLEKFKPLNNELQILMIKEWKQKDVAKNAQMFEITANKTAHNLVDFWNIEESIWYIFTYIENFNKLDNYIAHKILKCDDFSYKTKETQYWREIIETKRVNEWGKLDLIRKFIDHFELLDEEIAKQFIKRNRTKSLASNLDKFTLLSKKLYEKISSKLIESWDIQLLLENLEKFKWINHIKLIKEILNKSTDNLVIIMKNIRKFDQEWYTYLSKILNTKHYSKVDNIRDSSEDLSNELTERCYKEIDKTVINELNSILRIKNFSFKTINVWLEHLKWKTRHNVRLEIYHNQWNIENIKINNLDINFSWLEETIEVIKIIEEAITLWWPFVRYEEGIWIISKIPYFYDVEFQQSDNYSNKYDIICDQIKLNKYPTLKDKKACQKIIKYINSLKNDHNSML